MDANPRGREYSYERQFYQGPEAFSHVPAGLVSHLATTAEKLCTRCSQIDIPDYFTTALCKGTSEWFDERFGVGALASISGSAQTCALCKLMVEALRTATPDVFSMEPKTMDGDPVRVFLRSDVAGTYMLRTQRKVSARYISVYTNYGLPLRTSEVSKSRPLTGGSIRLLANDAHMIGQGEIFHGRLIGNHASSSMLWDWIFTCMQDHWRCDEIQYWWQDHFEPRDARFVDPVTMCLVRKPKYLTWLPWKYVALSYCWGGKQGLQLTKENHEDMKKPGFLSRKWDHIPKVIRDAIELVRDFDAFYLDRDGTDYDKDQNTKPDDRCHRMLLWVDQMCIVQDDPVDKGIQIAQMASMYSKATATIIAAEAGHSNMELSRLHPHDDVLSNSQSQQHVANVGGLRLLVGLPDLNTALSRSVWNTRGWTFQEAELSRTSIILTQHQAYFRCAQEVFQEDVVCEIPAEFVRSTNPGRIPLLHPLTDSITGRDKESRDDLLSKTAWHNGLSSGRSKNLPSTVDVWPQTFDMYIKAVEEYTVRTLGFSGDIINAFKGIVQLLMRLAIWDSPNGIVTNVLDLALLWRPNSSTLQRRFSLNGDPRRQPKTDAASSSQNVSPEQLAIPTWCWAAWQGPITYQPINYGIRSLVTRFESVNGNGKVKHIIRTSQHAGRVLESQVLEPPYPYAPQDCNQWENLKIGVKPATFLPRKYAHKMHLVDKAVKDEGDGPIILQFKAVCMSVILDSEPVNAGNKSDYGTCKRLRLLETNSKRMIGYIWYVPALEPILAEGERATVELVFLSKNETKVESKDGQLFRDEVEGDWDPWCLVNVLLIKRLQQGQSVAERLTIGKVLEDVGKGKGAEIIQLV